jgi:hypothetical protein
MNELEAKWEREMYELYEDARRLGYRATYFLQMAQDMGGLAAARRLLDNDEFHEGFTRLWELHRPTRPSPERPPRTARSPEARAGARPQAVGARGGPLSTRGRYRMRPSKVRWSIMSSATSG